MFTLEAAGKPIAITDASEDEARELFESEVFKEELMELETGGVPVWDGAASLMIRPATRQEIAEFENAPLQPGEDVDPESPMIMFLIDIDEPSEDESDASETWH